MIKRIVLAAHLKVGLFDMTLISKPRGIYLVGSKLFQVIDDIDIETAYCQMS